MIDKELSEKIRRTAAISEVENVMGRHAWYHAQHRHREEYFNLWVRNPENIFTWTNNFGAWIGAEHNFSSYVLSLEKSEARTFKKRKELFPEVDETGLYTFDNCLLHTLTTPVIEVAEDGMSAKAVWYTPATGIKPNDGGRNVHSADWMWERYAIDFILEDGEWRILHFTVLTDFSGGIVDSVDWMNFSPGGPPPEGVDAPPDDEGSRLFQQEQVPPNGPGNPTKPYGPTQAPQDSPIVPVPYRTLGETFNY